MRVVRLLTALCCVIALAGCIDVETVVRVRADGSGVVQERVLLSKNATALMQQMGQQMSEQTDENAGDAPPSPELSTNLLDRAELEQKAAAMGEGVRLVSAEPLSTERGDGYLAVYAFDDINELRINQNPSDKAPSGDGVQMQAPGEKEEFVTFQFHPGATPELIVHTPQKKLTKSNEAPEAETEAEQTDLNSPEGQMAMAMMKKFFDGLRMALAVEVEGRIVETNAAFHSGSRVTLMELDFGTLLEDMEKLQDFAARQPQSVAEAKRLMDSLPGIKAELSPRVRIRFSGTDGVRAASASADETPDGAPAASQRPPYRWRAVAVGGVRNHVRKLVQVTAVGGATHKGMLREVNGGRLMLKRTRLDGGGSVAIPVEDIVDFRVFDRGG